MKILKWLVPLVIIISLCGYLAYNELNKPDNFEVNGIKIEDTVYAICSEDKILTEGKFINVKSIDNTIQYLVNVGGENIFTRKILSCGHIFKKYAEAHTKFLEINQTILP